MTEPELAAIVAAKNMVELEEARVRVLREHKERVLTAYRQRRKELHEQASANHDGAGGGA